jgi:hypothetical protein
MNNRVCPSLTELMHYDVITVEVPGKKEVTMKSSKCLAGLMCLVSVVAWQNAHAFDIMEQLSKVRDKVVSVATESTGPLCTEPRHTVRLVRSTRDPAVEKVIRETGCFTIAKNASEVLRYAVEQYSLTETSKDASDTLTAIGLATGVGLLALVPKAVQKLGGENGVRVTLELSRVASGSDPNAPNTRRQEMGLAPITCIGESRSSTDRPSTNVAAARAVRQLISELKR